MGPPAARFWEKRDQNFYTFAPLAPLLTRVLSLDVLLDRELTASNRIVGRARFARCNDANPRARHKAGWFMLKWQDLFVVTMPTHGIVTRVVGFVEVTIFCPLYRC